MSMKKVSWKQACRWNWNHRHARLIWISGKTGRKHFTCARPPYLLDIILRCRERGIEMVDPAMTYQGREIQIPKNIRRRGLAIIAE